MKIRINHHKTTGLSHDAILIRDAILKYDDSLDVTILNYPEIAYVKNFETDENNVDVNIFLEHIYKDLIQYSKINIFFPNPEWCNSYDESLFEHINIICCKTQHCYKIFKKKYPDKEIVLTKFTSIDMKNGMPQFYNKCVHLKGVSKYKNSQVVLDTWMEHPEWPMLYIVTSGTPNVNGFLEIKTPVRVAQNITLYQTFIDKASLSSLMNLCGIHICCSFAEGYGHYINEARSVGAVVVTTNGGPMNEFSNILVNPVEKINVMNSVGYKINTKELEKTMNNVFKMSEEEMKKISNQNRKNYEDDKLYFENSVQKLMKKITSIIYEVLP